MPRFSTEFCKHLASARRRENGRCSRTALHSLREATRRRRAAYASTRREPHHSFNSTKFRAFDGQFLTAGRLKDSNLVYPMIGRRFPIPRNPTSLDGGTPTPTEYSGDTAVGSSASRNFSSFSDTAHPAGWRALEKRPARQFALLGDSSKGSGSFQLVDDFPDADFSTPATARDFPSCRDSIEDIASLSYDAGAIYSSQAPSSAPAPESKTKPLLLDETWSDLEVCTKNFPPMAKEGQQPGRFSAIRAMIKRTKRGFLVRMFRKSSSTVDETNSRDFSEVHLWMTGITGDASLPDSGSTTPIRGLSISRPAVPQYDPIVEASSREIYELASPIFEIDASDRGPLSFSWPFPPVRQSAFSDSAITDVGSSLVSPASTSSSVCVGGSYRQASSSSESFDGGSIMPTPVRGLSVVRPPSSPPVESPAFTPLTTRAITTGQDSDTTYNPPTPARAINERGELFTSSHQVLRRRHSFPSQLPFGSRTATHRGDHSVQTWISSVRDGRPIADQRLVHDGQGADKNLSLASPSTNFRGAILLDRSTGISNADATRVLTGSGGINYEEAMNTKLWREQQTQGMDGIPKGDSDLASTVSSPTTTQNQGYAFLLRYGFSSILSALTWSLDHLCRRYGPEQQVPKDHIRIRWTCKCGKRFFDDFVENRHGAARELEQHLNRPRARPSGDGSDSSSSVPLSDFPRSSSQTTWTSRDIGDAYLSAPSHRQPCSHIGSVDTNARAPAGSFREEQWLLACAYEGRFTAKVAHLDMDPTRIRSDMGLAVALKDLYGSTRRSWRNALRLRGLTTIQFVQFEMHRTRVVDIRKCPDMPPKGSKEYLFRPYDLIPPVGEQYLMHLFQNPEDYDEEIITYERIPKKRGTRLLVRGNEDIGVGWGIHLVEGFLADRVWTLVAGWFGLGSLVFAVVWAVRKGDVQGAFGAAAWVLALAALVIGWCESRVD